ncbi:MAG: hypothetical protein JJU20_12110 [Opitutales bacterium]|nr:hypothetical protein [Opitutales bacterium]
MSTHSRAVSILFFALGLLVLQAELNNWLAGMSLALNLDILLVLFCGLYLRILHGWWIVIFVGLLVDAGRPTPIGMNVIALILLWTLVVYYRRQIHRESPTHVIWTAVSLQTVWLLTLTLTMSYGRAGEWIYWQRFLLDGGLSLVFIALFAWPWCEIQRVYLKWSGWDLNAEIQRI